MRLVCGHNYLLGISLTSRAGTVTVHQKVTERRRRDFARHTQGPELRVTALIVAVSRIIALAIARCALRLQVRVGRSVLK